MSIFQSRLSGQGQVSVPEEIRSRLGVGPGSVIEWIGEDDQVVVRRARQYSCSDMHAALFPEGRRRTGEKAGTRDGLREYVNKRYARR